MLTLNISNYIVNWQRNGTCLTSLTVPDNVQTKEENHQPEMDVKFSTKP